ncbi:MAG: D-alanine--D-alanine ligase [Kiritimatiellae bacterium]|nr:D-alanine--D-alanine ligase [Kiritimatiellia bacterium]
MKRIAVLMGGVSSERDVSVQSGENVVRALSSLGTYDVVPVVLDEESLDAMPKDVDAVYIALHGGWGENGGVQAALNELNIPYTGPGVLASQIAMDKVKTKMVLEMKNVPTAAWGLAEPDAAVSPLPLPVVVKPPCDGSSVGISKVSRPEEWNRALDLAFSAQGSERPVLVEEFVPGREFTVAVVDGEAWPVLEIVAPGGWYGYDEKYVSNETRYPFLEEGDLAKKLRQIAIDAYRAVGCRGVTRVDFRVSPLGRCYVLELNTSPGFTAHSLVPKAGMHTGLTFAGVCDRILQSAATDRT